MSSLPYNNGTPISSPRRQSSPGSVRRSTQGQKGGPLMNGVRADIMHRSDDYRNQTEILGNAVFDGDVNSLPPREGYSHLGLHPTQYYSNNYGPPPPPHYYDYDYYHPSSGYGRHRPATTLSPQLPSLKSPPENLFGGSKQQQPHVPYDTAHQEQHSTTMTVTVRNDVPDITAGSTTWKTFLQAYTDVHDHRRAKGMLVSDIRFNSSSTFSEADSYAAFGEENFVETLGLEKSLKMPCRGYFYCTNNNDCPYRVNYSWHKKESIYKCNHCSLEHNHPPTDTAGLDGVQLVTKVTDVTREEREKIASLAVSCIGMAHIEETLRISYPKRDFHKTLLKNMVNDKRDEVFGKDRHNVNRVMELGRKCIQSGGVFEPEICPDTMRLVGFHYQTERQHAYAHRFGSYFSTADGTHDTNLHRLICVPYVCRCSLGISHLIGVGYHPSESSPNIIRSLKLFGISAIPAGDEDNVFGEEESTYAIPAGDEDNVLGEEGSNAEFGEEKEDECTVAVVNAGESHPGGDDEEMARVGYDDNTFEEAESTANVGEEKEDESTGVVNTEDGVDEEEETDNIWIRNTVAQNSYQGHLATDEAAWSQKVARETGKKLSLCAKHKSNAAIASNAGLPPAYLEDMGALIYHDCSCEELARKIIEARRRYGHRQKALTFINSIDRLKKYVCAAYTKYDFSLGHCTTSIGEGFNSVLKGNGSLKSYMADATLSTGIERCLKITRVQDHKCTAMLALLRQEERRWSNFFQHHYEEFAIKAGTDVISCERIGDSDQFWMVQDKFGHTVKVNKSATVVHLGHRYTIPICDCGFWCTWYIWCPHIIRVYTVSEDKLEVVTNVHPFHLLQNHPMWPYALKKCNLPDYDDFPHLTWSSSSVEKDCSPSTYAAESESTTAATSNITNTNVLPSQYYNQFDAMPDDEASKVNQLRELSSQCVSVAVTFGNDTTYRILHGRLTQALAECKSANESRTASIENPLPPNHGRSRRKRKSDLDNKSSLSFRSRRGGKRKQVRTNQCPYRQFIGADLKKFCRACNKNVSGTRAELIERLEEDTFVKDLLSCSDDDLLRQKCRDLRLLENGATSDLVLRLLSEHFQTRTSVTPATNSGQGQMQELNPQQQQMLQMITSLIQAQGALQGNTSGDIPDNKTDTV